MITVRIAWRRSPTSAAVLALSVVLAVGASACGRETDGAGQPAQNVLVERRACTVDLPAQWTEAIATSRVDAGGTSSSPRAVSPTGEVVAIRDSGPTHDLLLIGTDKSVRELATLPEPDEFVIGGVGIDDRWIVFEVVRSPRNANGVLPQVVRLELIDRQTGVQSTVAEQSAGDAAASPERNVLDGFALSGGKVYWITRDEYNGDNGVAHSFDPVTGDRADIASGPIRDIRTGSEWSGLPATLPTEVAGLSAEERALLGTDGTAFGWISSAPEGGAGVGYWSSQTGVVTVSGVDVEVTEFLRPALVFDSLVIIDAGGSTTCLGYSATIVDTRTGAVARLTPRVTGQYDAVVAARDGTLALRLWAGPGGRVKQPDYAVGMLRPGTLTSLAC